MAPYAYATLPGGPFTRMIRLLPNRERDASIECGLFDYDLSDSDRGNHLYEALSYTWGSPDRTHSINIGGSSLPVTENLHTALSYLRDHQLERTLWVDAICINQEDEGEKEKQIPLMRSIYAQADRVIVWLGKSDSDGGNALEIIRRHAESKRPMRSNSSHYFQRVDYSTCTELLKHDWFRRIWVLQEVGVARCVTIQCGLTQINGYAFCEGLSRLKKKSLPQHILPVIPLIKNSIFRPRHTPNLPGTLSIGELIDMYRSHLATVLHDKVYALLGLCADNLNTPCLRPDYDLPLDEVVKQVTAYIFGGQCTVKTVPNTHIAVIQGKGWILGRIDSVKKDRDGFDQQNIGISFCNISLAQKFEESWGTKWLLQTPAVSLQPGDIVCLLQGASQPSIVRLCKSQITVITSTVIPERASEGREKESPQKVREKIRSHIESCETHAIDLIFTWAMLTANGEDIDGPMKIPVNERLLRQQMTFTTL
ncbi:HET-domain-containing protein [Aspergillus sclerotiicarbonarius CBS 121057]|uniref:HET-domain-containing protein n=1 Tax=Aspergillus sclerotiicarbonarius (strain CBS 121057 / IBT 28362) TaxID=1448318 RepID=A0A319DXA7_ASPSB|nr:HET-domain-containing protein [Aspergillus sclerotiicarbonarius CBS 121057]